MSSRNIVFAAAGVSGETATYIEDVFSTWLYAGNGSTQTITNGIDIAGKGGLVWTKDRTYSYYSHELTDTVRGTNSSGRAIYSNLYTAQGSGDVVGFTTSGFNLGFNNGGGNGPGSNYVSWTFAKQEKFFDIVTYTGNGSLQNINHSLGSTPGMIIIRSTSLADYWAVYHRSTGATQYLTLNNTSQAFTNTSVWNDTEPTSTQFTVGSYSAVNANGQSYVAYLFAHNAGGFGESGTDNVISCGTYTGTGTANININLGFEPQFILTKRADGSGGWFMQDIMRQMSLKNTSSLLAQTKDAETQWPYNGIRPNATGFTLDIYNNWNASGATYIYMAIRRPMKVPTDATTVFKPFLQNDSVVATTNFPVDMFTDKDTGGGNSYNGARLLGGAYLKMQTTAAQSAYNPVQTGFENNTGVTPNLAANPAMSIYAFARRPGFFDVVCWSGSGASVNHNLGVAPQLIFYKTTSQTSYWGVYCSLNPDPLNSYLFLQTTGTLQNAGQAVWQNMTSTTFGMTAYIDINATANVAYLFATCPGVSKVGTYTGTGAAQTINCGFTGGARFVMIKSLDNASDWWVWDTARGMVNGTDPSLAFNTIDPQYNFNSVYTATTGFQLLASPAQSVNNSGEKYIYLAIA